MTQQVHRYTCDFAGKELIIETGKLAQQAGGAVTVRLGDTMVFATATMSKSARDGISFFPLSVDYEERLYAGGRIPGSYFRREGRPSEQAILIARVVDRTLRPLFPKGLRNEVQVILLSLSHDGEHQIDMLGIIAASAALAISDVPWNGPVAGVRVGLIDGELVVNPTHSQMEDSLLDLRVSGTTDAVNMVECGANEVDEETMVRALMLAHESIQPVIETINRMREEVGKPKAEFTPFLPDEAVVAEVRDKIYDRVREIIMNHTDKTERAEALSALRDELIAEYEQRNADAIAAAAEGEEPAVVSLSDVAEGFEAVVKEAVRQRIIKEGIRPDGRGYTDIRPLSAEVSIVPRVHGSGLFSRGETQVLTILTLGTPRDAKKLDGLSPEETRRYLHHYNFPPYSTGEVAFLRGPKRREIGHGALAETALRAMIPPEEEFPYTLRLVSEVMSSNGSTSMASVCGSTLALMDAGVPIIRPVAGIAMGLIKEGDDVAVLTDIQGMEDHLGDMDFKVAGTTEGITALQMDIKIAGVTEEVLRRALAQAREARMKILDVILEAIPEPRSELNDYAPRMETFRISPDKIGQVIGPGGKTIRAIQDKYDVKIDIEEDGLVYVAGVNGPSVMGAIEEVRALTEEAEIGRIYTGRVTRVEDYGAFVEFLPGQDGLVHVSQLADYRVESVASEVKVGDEIMVMVIDIDRDGKVRLSRQAVLEGWTVEEARSRDRGSRSGGNRGGRGGNRGGGNRGGGRGGNRGGGRGGDRRRN